MYSIVFVDFVISIILNQKLNLFLSLIIRRIDYKEITIKIRLEKNNSYGGFYLSR